MQLEMGQTPDELRLENAFAPDMERVLNELYSQPLQNGLLAQEGDLADWTLDYYDNHPDLIALLSGVLFPYLVGAFNIGGQLALEALGINGTFALQDESVLGEIEDATNDLASINGQYSLLQTTANDLERQITGLEVGLSLFEVFAALSLYIGGRALFRSRNIAETEAVRASRLGLLHAYQKNGVTVAIHRTQEDNRVCPICNPLNGNEYPLGIDGRVAMIPFGEQIPLHTKCRCWYDFGERVEIDEVWLGG